MKIKRNNRQILVINYLNYILLLLSIYIIVMYIFNNYLVKKREDGMLKVINLINYNEIDTYLIENNEVLIYTKDNENNNLSFTKKNIKLINDNELSEKMLYLKLDELTDDTKVLLDNLYNMNDITITTTPNILIFRDGELISIIDLKSINYDIKLIKDILIENNIIKVE